MMRGSSLDTSLLVMASILEAEFNAISATAIQKGFQERLVKRVHFFLPLNKKVIKIPRWAVFFKAIAQ